MRELIYLSERKLQQFQEDDTSGGMLRRIQQLGAKGPAGLGELNVTLSPDTTRKHPTLPQVLNHIDRSDRPARWYQEDGLRPGDWAHFEAPLCYSLLGRTGTEGPLVFWDPRHVTSGVELLLHGSMQHLVGSPPGDGVFTGYSSTLFFRRFLQSLRKSDQARLEPVVANLLLRLAAQGGHEFASWMAGYARISAVVNSPRGPRGPESCVIASPLYVEYISPPEET